MDAPDNKKCWCYLTYVFSVDDVPPLPLPRREGQIPVALNPASDPEAVPGPAGFEPSWFFNQKFPEDEE